MAVVRKRRRVPGKPFPDDLIWVFPTPDYSLCAIEEEAHTDRRIETWLASDEAVGDLYRRSTTISVKTGRIYQKRHVRVRLPIWGYGFSDPVTAMGFKLTFC